ncbi:MAG: hypothetical protein ACFE9D_05805 [Promethearchaeota archaeon]
MKALHPHGKRSILSRMRRAIGRLPSTSSTSIMVPNTPLVSSGDVGIDRGSWVPKSVQRQAWIRSQQQKSRAIHLKRIQRIDW